MWTKVTKIISGGQTGADRAGLDAARFLGIETGGYAPYQFKTEYGCCIELKTIYGLVETSTSNYSQRTHYNVKESDATVIFCKRCDSEGTKYTKDACDRFNKPFIVNPTPTELARFLDKYNVKILNVAGNRHSVSKSIYCITFNTLVSALSGEYLKATNQSRLNI